MSRLEARRLTCARGPALLFRDVSLQLDAGEWMALRGANGSGKTTLLRCAAGLTRPDAGDVLWDGVDTRRADSTFRAELIYAGHAPGIKDELTATENLAAALTLRGVSADAARIADALAQVGLTRHRNLPARRLSAGQRRRIGLARLLLDPAGLWILDEPLTALDDEGHAIFSRALERHAARGGLALIATHHDVRPKPARTFTLGP